MHHVLASEGYTPPDVLVPRQRRHRPRPPGATTPPWSHSRRRFSRTSTGGGRRQGIEVFNDTSGLLSVSGLS